ncbi:COG4315 family predicted lipoprotein [Streptomyces werraensis]|uniref:COG4315 family predicted lipoprotein n=1 Tax=Streptomyces werraensis TaxID=68284 RepID=UPI0033BD7B00
MSRHRIPLALASAVASALLLAACGSSADNSASTGAAAPEAPAEASAPADAGSSAPGGGMGMVSTNMLMTKEMSGIGAVVTDAKGWTLYRYDKDMESMSMCTGSCAQTWMPVMPDGTPQAMGVQGKVGTITRDDGMKQLTLAGWPLYRYMGDAKAGDMNGQGKDGAWYAVTPAGKEVGTSSGAASSSGDSSGSDSGSTGGDSGSSDSMPGMPGM